MTFPTTQWTMLDSLKDVGFLFATLAGISIGIDDMVVPGEKAATAIADFLVVDMFANYCTGTKDAKTAISECERQLKRIYR